MFYLDSIESKVDARVTNAIVNSMTLRPDGHFHKNSALLGSFTATVL